MGTNPVKSQPLSQPPIVTSAPYGNLAERCKELGTAIVQMADVREKVRPNPAVDREAYNNWYRENDGLGFHAHFYEQAAKIHKELADPHIDDPELDDSCLSGCFSKVQQVVWTSASPRISKDLAGVSIEVCH